MAHDQPPQHIIYITMYYYHNNTVNYISFWIIICLEMTIFVRAVKFQFTIEAKSTLIIICCSLPTLSLSRSRLPSRQEIQMSRFNRIRWDYYRGSGIQSRGEDKKKERGQNNNTRDSKSQFVLIHSINSLPIELDSISQQIYLHQHPLTSSDNSINNNNNTKQSE